MKIQFTTKQYEDSAKSSDEDKFVYVHTVTEVEIDEFEFLLTARCGKTIKTKRFELGIKTNGYTVEKCPHCRK